MTPEEQLFQDALQALTKKEYARARDLFTRLLKLNRQNPEYWVGMSMAVDTLKERAVCLREALKLDPDHELAKRGLILMGEKVDNPPPEWKFAQFRTDWKAGMVLKQEKKVKKKGSARRALGWSLTAILFVGAVVGGILLMRSNRYRPDTSPILRVTLPPTGTPTLTPEISDTPEGPELLNTHPDTAFTPTAMYVATPHNRSEAYSQAIKAFQQEDYTRAVQLLQQVLAEEPGSADLQYLIGEAYRMQGNQRDAQAAFDAGVKANPSYAPLYLGKARLIMQYTPSKYKDALTFLNKALVLDPHFNEARLEMVNLFLARGDEDSALVWLQQYEGNNAPSALVEYTRARILLMQGDSVAALSTVEQARELDISYLPTYLLWGQTLQANDLYEESLVPLLTYLRERPGNTEAQVLLADAYFHTGDNTRALSTIQSVLSANNQMEAAYLLRGDIYMSENELVKADNDYLRAQQLNYRSFGAFIGRARVQLAYTYAGAAYNYLDQAVDVAATPREEAIALYWRAVALVGLKETGAAIRDYEALLALPEGAVPPSLLKQAKTEYLAIVTPTPSATATQTFTPSATSTATATSSITPTATATLKSTSSQTASPTPSPTH
jgi:tetratricopeptide (TPR) repeat protein